MRRPQLHEAGSLFRRRELPLIEPVYLLEHSIDARWADGHHVVVEHHEGQSAISFEGIVVVEIDNGSFFRILEPPIVGDLAAVLIDFALTVFPVAKLGPAEAAPTQELTCWKLREVSPMLDVVDNLITRVVGNPGSVQGSSSSFS